MSSKARRAAGEDRRALATSLYATMVRIRCAELRILKHVQEEHFGGLWHPGLGQEAAAAGVVATLSQDDHLYATHRGVGHVLAKGMALESVFGDVLVRRCGSARGKGAGTPHFSDPKVGVMGFGGTLGSSFVLGAGTALGTRLLGRDRVTVVFFGDGAASRGTFHEAAIPASTWKLPVVWVCENNRWSLSASFADQNPTATIAERASAYGMPGLVVDGQDALAVHAAATEAVEKARAGDGPTLLELVTVRMRGHYEGDQEQYRDDRATAGDPELDPLQRLRPLVGDEVADRLHREAAAEVERAFEATLAAPAPPPDVIFEDVYA